MQTVLIVEDDAQLRTSLAAALTDDYLVKSAGSGREAIGFLRESMADVVLLDMVMSEGDGFTVLGHIAGMSPKPHVVVLSVLDQIAKAVKAIRLGANDYLVKPCDLHTVRTAIRQALPDRA